MTLCRHLCFVACICFIPSLVNADVYRCAANGRTVYSDKPCAGGDSGRIAAGMTVNQVEQAWGKPAETILDNDFQVTTERWTYISNGDVTNVFIRNGAVTWIDGPHPVMVVNEVNTGFWIIIALCLLVFGGGLAWAVRSYLRDHKDLSVGALGLFSIGSDADAGDGGSGHDPGSGPNLW